MTANKQRGELALEMKGMTLVLRPTYEAIAKIEAETGKSVVELTSHISRAMGVGYGTFLPIIFHGAKASGETVKREQIGDALVRTGIMNVTPTVVMFLQKFLEGDEEIAAEGEE